MPRRSTPVTQADVTRLIKGVIAAGLGMERIAEIKMTRDGVVVLFGDSPAVNNGLSNEWDEVLK